MMKANIPRGMHRTERGSAGSNSAYRRLARIYPALPRSVLLLFASSVCARAQTSPDTRAQLLAYIETGRYIEAEATAKKILLKTPDNGAVRHELAETLALTGRHTEAITEFERAAADSARAENIGDKLESDLRRAEVFTLIGQEDRAKTIYESFVTFYT